MFAVSRAQPTGEMQSTLVSELPLWALIQLHRGTQRFGLVWFQAAGSRWAPALALGLLTWPITSHSANIDQVLLFT